jgi:hypothetical protein
LHLYKNQVKREKKPLCIQKKKTKLKEIAKQQRSERLKSSGRIMIPLFSLRMNFAAMAMALLYLTTVKPWRVNSDEQQTLMVNMTLVTNARETSACKLNFNLFSSVLLFIIGYRVPNMRV